MSILSHVYTYANSLTLAPQCPLVLLPSALARGNINRNLFSGYMYVCTYVCTYVRTFGHLRRRVRVGVYSLRRRRRLDVYARIQYRLGAYRKLGACETRFIAFATLNATF